MLVYALVIGTIPIYSVVERKSKKIAIFFMSLQLFLLLALRNETVGVDLGNYSGGYEYISSLSLKNMIGSLRLIKLAKLVWPYSYESGYVVINWIIAKLGFNFHDFLVLHALFSIFSFSVFVKRFSKIPWLSFMFFACMGMYNYLFGILRQTLALSILLFSVPYIIKKKFWKFSFLVFLAFTVHRISIIFLPLYFVYRFKQTKMRTVIYMILCFASIILMPGIYQKIIIPIVSYMGKSVYSYAQFKMNNMIILMTSILVFILLFNDFIKIREDNNSLLYWAFLLSFPIEIIGMYNDGIARALEIYLIFLCVLIPNLIYRYSSYKIKNLIKLILPVLLLAFEIYLLKDTSQMIPYSLYLGWF